MNGTQVRVKDVRWGTLFFFGRGTNLDWESGEQIRLLVHLHAVLALYSGCSYSVIMIQVYPRLGKTQAFGEKYSNGVAGDCVRFRGRGKIRVAINGKNT